MGLGGAGGGGCGEEGAAAGGVPEVVGPWRGEVSYEDVHHVRHRVVGGANDIRFRAQVGQLFQGLLGFLGFQEFYSF